MVALLCVGGEVFGEVVGPEIGETGVVVGQQTPDDDEDGAPDGDDRSFLASAFGDAPVAFAQEGVGSGGCHGDLTEDAGQVTVPVAGGPVSFGFSGRAFEAG